MYRFWAYCTKNMFAIRAAEKNELVTPQDIDPNFTSQMVKMATYEAPGITSPISELWQPNLTPYPTSNVMCVNCCRIVKTRTTYRPGPKGKKPFRKSNLDCDPNLSFFSSLLLRNAKFSFWLLVSNFVGLFVFQVGTCQTLLSIL